MINNVKSNLTARTLREIYRMNIGLSFIAFIFSMFFLKMFDEPMVVLISMAFKSGVYMLLLTFTLSFVLNETARRFQDSLIKYRLWRIAVSFFSAILLQLLIWPVFAYFGSISWDYSNYKLLLIFIIEGLILATLVLLLQDFAILRYAKAKTELENARLQMRTTEAENLLLKQQIHPHFLFNSLNTLKALYKKDLVLGEEYLIQLANFLRSAVSHNNSQATTLDEELIFCINYLKMQKIRFNESLDWELKIENEAMLKGYVPSFSIQPLLENAIKHNKLTKLIPLRIVIEQNGDYISVSNSISNKEFSESSIKSGLENLSERYFLWSGDTINIKNDGVTFSVSFKIIQHENSNN
ncbi:sensor histidine kinase [Flavobacterium sp. CF136]|jgi:sensor histidine kinase YesM|uniref:sensor histidine kinase n=1 Tax=Flavobacterium sp. (strain CF136) TaxID=1144313 RepID=UPI0002718521|nr:histidine kinase [Flavobacterium sp. CF136]EJL65790.1 putative regulator of cell autolysis [Flavobacterium sp. CF136]